MFQIEPTLCRECAIRTLRSYTLRTLVQGWWGLISLFVANPATILLNLWNLTKAYRMDRPYLSSPLETETAFDRAQGDGGFIT